jgi:hypothetical protein
MTSAGLSEVEAALAAVRRTLDTLTARGCDREAFNLARVQYAASIRNSFPANLGAVATALTKLAEDATIDLSEEERADLVRAAAVFVGVRHD